MKSIFKLKGMTLIPVNAVKFSDITNAIEKARFIRTHEIGTYEFANDGYLAIEYLYMIIDTKNDGYCLTPKHGKTYNEATDLINMYL